MTNRLEGYINADSFVTATPDEPNIPGAGNGFMNTGLAWACGMYDDVPISTMLFRCRLSSKVPLIWRSPYKNNADDNQAQDDYEGALPMSQAWAKEVLEYAEDNDWDFSMREEDNGNIKYWFGRFLHFPPFVRVCAGEDLSYWSQLMLLFSFLLFSAQISDADTNKKSFCMLKKSYDKIFLGKSAFKFWISRVRKKYGTIGASWAMAHPGHPVNNYDGENLWKE